MTGTHKTITTLWSIIETMQGRLERQGLDDASVDATVLRSLASMLFRGRTGTLVPLWPRGAAVTADA